MMDFLAHLEWWHWWVLAAVLAAVETFMPGAVAIWFAASALVVGALLLLVAIPWQLQLVLFGVLGVVAILVYRRHARRQPETSVQPALNRRGLEHLGQELELIEPIEHGSGKVRAGDTVWKVSGPDAPAGARVRVTGADGTVLQVEPVQQGRA
ncbi:MAG: NfeD family protein [Gammaproteobacteria bacterium]|nr:NfeD family protein [Gammaproteobacteria bacterium]